MSPLWHTQDWDGVSFTWDLWYSCNYRCGYCWFEMDRLWSKLAKTHLILPPERWQEIWDRMYERYGTVRLDILGGEPLLYPRVEELFERLSEKHRLVVTTNLFIETDALRRLLDRVHPDRVHFYASFHPQFTPLDVFIKKALLLRARGFAPAVLCVSWPPFLDRLAEYRAAFWKENIPFSLSIFDGTYEGKAYPEGFSREEKVLLSRFIPDEDEIEYRLLREETLGKLCHSGRVYANIKGSGDVFRCAQDVASHRPMGNILDADFKLNDASRACPYPQCRCKEFRYLAPVSEKKEAA